jgi:hypothetical protein
VGRLAFFHCNEFAGIENLRATDSQLSAVNYMTVGDKRHDDVRKFFLPPACQPPVFRSMSERNIPQSKNVDSVSELPDCVLGLAGKF